MSLFKNSMRAVVVLVCLFSQFDFSVMKLFVIPSSRRLGDSARFELRMNAYNAFNQLNLQPFVFGSSSTVLSYGNTTNGGGQTVPVPNPQFGLATGGLGGRVVELQGRFSF